MSDPKMPLSNDTRSIQQGSSQVSAAVRGTPVRLSWRERFSGFEQLGLLITLVALGIILSSQTPVFLSERNILNVLRQISMTMIAGVGMTTLLISGEVDLSIGSLQAVVAVVVMDVLNRTQNLWLGILAGLAIGAVVGLGNGLIVTKLKVNSLIATLAMMMILRGSAYAYTQAAIQNTHGIAAFGAIGNGYLGPIPWPVIIMASVMGLFYILLNHSVVGRKIYASGGNPLAAIVAGIKVQQIKILSFIICSGLASVSAIILVSRMNSGQNNAGMGFELMVIAAVLLGGSSLRGGQGSLLGTLLGSLILGVLANGIILLRLNYNWQVVLTGIVILIAIWLDQSRKKMYGEG